MKVLAKAIVVSSLLTASVGLASSYENAQNLRDGLRRVQNVVDRAISSAGGMHGSNVWDTAEILESDAAALPIFVQASGNLAAGAQAADESTEAFLSANTAFGNIRFAVSCSKLGIARSQLARANFAALQPPLGMLAAFGDEIREATEELNTLRTTVTCP